MMNNEEQYWIACETLPLAVYREVVAHLRQVPGVDAEVLPQTSTQFDYGQSQAGGLRYGLPLDNVASRPRVTQILQYYGDRFGPWQSIPPPTADNTLEPCDRP